MGTVMVKCPDTGRDISTGIVADRESFNATPVFFARVYCPLCQVEHEWFAKEAWVCEPSVEGTRGSICDLPQMMCWPYRNPEPDAGAQ